MVSARVLLEGMWYCLEQCGILLRDAVTLYERGSRATAVGLAMLAREEMGKARILRDLWREGRPVTADEVRAALDDHVEKQRMAQVSELWTAGGRGTPSGETGVAKLLRTITTAGHAPAEREAASRALEELGKRRQKRTPLDRHTMRMKAMYVDLDEAGTSWSRPSNITTNAHEIINHLAGDYAGQRDRLQPELLDPVDPKLAEALRQWPERPALLEPAWPTLTTENEMS
jgi:AbiV family abortive infection protein